MRWGFGLGGYSRMIQAIGLGARLPILFGQSRIFTGFPFGKPQDIEVKPKLGHKIMGIGKKFRTNSRVRYGSFLPRAEENRGTIPPL